MASKFAALAEKALGASRTGAASVPGTSSNVSSILSRVKSLAQPPRVPAPPPYVPPPSYVPTLPAKPSLMNRLSQASAAFQTATAPIDVSMHLEPHDASFDHYAAAATSSGTSLSTWLLITDIILFLIGIILIMTSQSKCQTDPNSDSCKNYRLWGITFTAICSVLMIVILYFKFKN